MALTTGLNPERAKRDISNFEEEYFMAVGHCAEALESFLQVLEENWASPNAVQFFSSYQDRLNDGFITVPSNEGNKIVEGAIEAFNSISSANGGPTLGYHGGRTLPTGSYNFREEIDGDVGMNIANVAVAAIDFKTDVTAGLDELINVPKQIAFYDPAGEQAATYETGIVRVHNYIESTENLLVGLVQTAIQEEQNNINLGKEASVQAMEYSAPGAV